MLLDDQCFLFGVLSICIRGFIERIETVVGSMNKGSMNRTRSTIMSSESSLNP